MSTVRLRRFAALAAFAYLSSTVLVMASERVYWYWAGLGVESLLSIGGFYLLPTLAMLWAVTLTPARRLHQVVLAGAVFAFVVEGVLTSVVYTDGPLPVLAALFVGWHGMLSVVAFWYLAHLWLVTGNLRRLAVGSALVGAGWGLWAAVASLADPPSEFPAATVLTPGGFAVYAFGVGATLAAAHWLLGFVWPAEWRPGRRATAGLAFVTVAYLAVNVVPAVPWAPLKLTVLVGATAWLLRRSHRHADGPTVLAALAGRVRLRDTAVLLALPAVASAVYALAATVASTTALTVSYWALVAGQVVVGAVAYGWAARASVTSMAAERDIPALTAWHRIP